ALQNRLGKNIEHTTIEEKWKHIESQTGKPLVFILDQAEEIYTDPANERPNELTDFLGVLKTIFGNPVRCPRGKLILGYRKEYHPEIDKKFQSYQLPRAYLFLEPLSREDIMEVVTAIAYTTELNQYYRNLEVEKDLPVIIADDLLEDANSPIAPVLQIILTKMWNNEPEAGSPNARFTIQKYWEIRKEGFAMGDFFKQQMAKLRAWNRETVDSG
ncbi:MAG: hypothetical protein GY940_30800, partial [bacterium]|nr:hypothetical protein [bacterium]